MQARKLGRTGMQATPIGLGGWAVGGWAVGGLGPRDEGESVGAIGRASEHGAGWIGVAAGPSGEIETSIGRGS